MPVYTKALEDPNSSIEVMREKLMNYLVARSDGCLIQSDIKNPLKILELCGKNNRLFVEGEIAMCHVSEAGGLVDQGIYRLIPKPTVSFRGEQQTA